MKNIENIPEISIIVPVYNVEEYLQRCVESILAQTFDDFEIILVDDGSTDSSSELCDAFKEKDSRIRVLHKRNGGLSDARNKGIEISYGKYITFVDSDDWVAEDFLEVLYGLIKDYSADLSMCGHEVKKTFDYSRKKSRNIIEYSQSEFLKILFRVHSNRCEHYAWGKLYKREILDMKEQFPYKMYNEDVESTFKSVLKCKKIVETKYPCYFYYYNEKGISHNTFGENFLSLLQVWNRIVELFEANRPDMLYYADINRKRTYFTILLKSITYGNRESDKRYKKILKNIRKNLARNLIDLLRAPIVLNRKISMIIMVVFYDGIKKIYRMVEN